MREVCIQQNAAGPFVTMLPHGMVLWFVGVRPVVPVIGVTNIDGAASVPTVDGLGKGMPIVEGGALGIGTITRGLMSALPISTEPNGIPGRETALGDAEGVAAVDEPLADPVPQIDALPGTDPAIPIPPPS
jgi:hypothetical protein